MKPTDTLREEHNLELAVTRAAEHEVRFMHDTGECRFEVVETIVDFFHYFTRACHEPKEESLIFARMATRGLPADHGILAELTREHEEFRRRIKEISQWLRDRRAGKTAPVAQLESKLDDYLKLMRAHVSKENDILLPLANQLLTDLDQVEIESAFAALECEQTMVGVREKYNELAHQLANRPTEVLLKEHRIVLVATAAAEREVQAMRETGQLRTATVAKLIEFYRYFATACHDPKEENLLFTRLKERGVSAEEGILAELWREHQEFRSRLEAIEAAFVRANKGDRTAVPELADHLARYLELMRRHTVRENEVLFPMVGHVLSPADLEELTRRYESAEAEEITKGVHDRYFDLAHELAVA
jgi:hemerythrin-like domain-containing protein